jgi:hypothetical protein
MQVIASERRGPGAGVGRLARILTPDFQRLPRTTSDTPPRHSRQPLLVPAGSPVLSAIGVLTTTDDKREFRRCHDLGCTIDVTKPVNYENFANAIQQFGPFFAVIQVFEAE